MATAAKPDGSMRVGFGGDVGGAYRARPVTFLIEPTAGGVAPQIEQWEVCVWHSMHMRHAHM